MKHLLHAFSDETKKFLRFSGEGVNEFVSSLETTEAPTELTEEQKEEQVVLDIEKMIVDSPKVAEELGKYLREQEKGESDILIESALERTAATESNTQIVESEEIQKWQSFYDQCQAFLAKQVDPTDETKLGKNQEQYNKAKEILKK